MKNVLIRLRHILRSFHREQAGTALTEFVITMPVYLFFFSGIITLHQLQEVRLYSHQKTSAELWEKAVDMQTSYFSGGLSPGAGAINTGAYYAKANDLASITGALDTGDAALGMYFESGIKAGAIDNVPFLNANITPEPKMNLAPDIMNEESHAHTLMNDRIFSIGSCNGSGIGNILCLVLSGTGARPSLAAGIRYGVVGAVDKTNYNTPLFDNNNVKARYNVAAPTYPNERWEALALSRLEMSNGHDAYDELLEFGIVSGSGSAPRVKAPNQEDGNCGGNPGGGDTEQCQQEYDAYLACMDTCQANDPDATDCPCDEPECSDVSNPQDNMSDISFENAGEGGC